MKFGAYFLLLGCASAIRWAETPTWGLKSVKDHRTDSATQKSYGDYSTERANGRPPY